MLVGNSLLRKRNYLIRHLVPKCNVVEFLFEFSGNCTTCEDRMADTMWITYFHTDILFYRLDRVIKILLIR